MTINWMELRNRDSIAARCVTKMFMQLARAADPENTDIRKAPGFAELDTTDMDVTLTVEGKEVDFVEMVEWFATIHDEEVLKQAKEYMERKIGDMLGPVQETLDELVSGLYKKMREELGIVVEEEF